MTLSNLLDRSEADVRGVKQAKTSAAVSRPKQKKQTNKCDETECKRIDAIIHQFQKDGDYDALKCKFSKLLLN